MKTLSNVQSVWSAYCGKVSMRPPPLDVGFTPGGGPPWPPEFLSATRIVSPCVPHTCATVINLLFLAAFLHQALVTARREKRLREFPADASPANGHVKVAARLTAMYTFSRWACWALGLKFVVLLMAAVVSSPPGGVPVELYLYAIAGVVVLILLSRQLAAARSRAEEAYPLWLRVWLVANLVVTGVLGLLAMTYVSRGDLWGSILSWASLPFALVLAVGGLSGRTGVVTQEADGAAYEPLLPDGQEQQGVQPGDLVGPAEVQGCETLAGYYTAGFLSVLTFQWLGPTLKLGSTKALEAEDVPYLGATEVAETAYAKFQANWDARRLKHPGKKPSVAVSLWASFYGQLIVTGVLVAFKAVIMYAGPLLLKRFVDFTAGKRAFAGEGYTLVAALFVAKALETITDHQYNFRSEVLGYNVRSALIGALFHKGLRLSSKAKQSHTTGEIINYMSTDAQRLADLAWELHNIWVLPLQIILALIILFEEVGVAMLAGLGCMAVTMALNLYIATRQRAYMMHGMKTKDQRMKATTEALASMKVIKLYAWQGQFLKKVESIREEELGWLAKFTYIAAVNIFLLWLSPLLVSVCTFGTMLWVGIPLTTGSVFTAIATFRILQEPLRSFPQVIASVTQAMVSLDRLTKFMTSEEIQPDAVERTPLLEGGDMAPIELRMATFAWDTEAPQPTLRNINLTVTRGARVAICGTVGSGKSSLLAALLGEMPRVAGTARVSGSIAYVAQSAWIQNGSIQDNILFGKGLDSAKYAETLRVTSLVKDLTLFPNGDKTEIGERGINLSGGQKQRIQLARAVYQDCDTYLLDDPFSAVDAHTGTALFMDCVVGALADKTVVLVTHQVEFLPAADLILVVREGEVVQSGRYEDLLSAGTDFGALVDAHNEAMDAVDDAQQAQQESAELAADGAAGSPAGIGKRSHSTSLPRKSSSLKDPKKEESGEAVQLIAAEERETGKVNSAVYWAYITKVLRGRHVPVLLTIQLIWQLLQISSDWWLAKYTSPTSGVPVRGSRFMEVYAALAMGSGFFVLLRTVLISWSGLRTTQAFFLSMLRSIFSAPMAFFDSTPMGRILARASTDQNTLDIELPFMFGSLLAMVYQLTGILVVTSFVTWPVIFVIVPLGIMYLRYQRYYITSSRELARVNGITKAPIIQQFGESLAGSMTIHAFEQSERYMATNLERVNTNIRVAFHYNASNEWLGVRLETIGAVILCFSALMLVVLPKTIIDPGLAGMSLSYGLALNQGLFWVVWLWCTLENEMVSVERIRQYSELTPEAPLVIDECKPPSDWPSAGTVVFDRLQARYREDMPLVLKGVNLTVKGGDKVGVVGRTGSGKSTLVQVLFRIVEPSAGTILIDGIDITTIGLSDLRLHLSIIPQEPTLFDGNVRTNLDPLGVYKDEEIWEALDKCQLGDVIRAEEKKLDTTVAENGENWSVGQRQLFCLGRALLKRSRILVLDEATASVDTKTDTIIQRTIKENFGRSTVVSVAHRIPTVIDSDKVLVLEQGEVAEYDSPAKLLEKRSSMFSKLVAEYSARSTGMASIARPSSSTDLGSS